MWDFLTEREAEFCQNIIDQSSNYPAVQSISNMLSQNGGVARDNMPFLFELRFAQELARLGYDSSYEVPGDGASSIDFEINPQSDFKILAELVSVRASEAINEATQIIADDFGMETRQLILSTNNEDPRFSEEGEVLLVQQKVCEKTSKFPEATSNNPNFHLIVVDMRGFLGGNGGDNHDCIQLCYGNSRVPEHCQRYWQGNNGERNPIVGLFEPSSTRPRGVNLLKERVHAILFTRDTQYTAGSLLSLDSCCVVCNPHLLSQEEALRLKDVFFTNS